MDPWEELITQMVKKNEKSFLKYDERIYGRSVLFFDVLAVLLCLSMLGRLAKSKNSPTLLQPYVSFW